MDIESVRAHCLSFPQVTEVVLWGNDLVFKIGGKMFAVIGLDSASDHCLSFKCTPEKFADWSSWMALFPRLTWRVTIGSRSSNSMR
jgi:predicted DNA-binding protein (MmcQ/YjbR family)